MWRPARVNVNTAVSAINAQVNIEIAIERGRLEPSPTSGETVAAARNCVKPIRPEPEPIPISRTSSIPSAVALAKISGIIGTVMNSNSQVVKKVIPTRALIIRPIDVTSMTVRATKMPLRG